MKAVVATDQQLAALATETPIFYKLFKLFFEVVQPNVEQNSIKVMN